MGFWGLLGNFLGVLSERGWPPPSSSYGPDGWCMYWHFGSMKWPISHFSLFLSFEIGFYDRYS